MSAHHLIASTLFLNTSLSLSIIFFSIPVPSQSAGREERDLKGSYCTVKPGWKRRIPSDLRS